MTYLALENKIKTVDELVNIAAELKQQAKIVVTNNGSYDIMHLGHIYGLFNAKEQGDVLMVGLNSDASIKSYKSVHRPINDEKMRLRMLAALSCVDYVFLFEETTPHAWLERLKPQIHTNGAEYGNECIERNLVEAQGGKIHLLPMVKGYKTSLIIDKIKQCPA
tara:strand:+ start:1231 stop:1722 length:492 start_codon:yes stop_codon:yes gene_type:complete